MSRPICLGRQFRVLQGQVVPQIAPGRRAARSPRHSDEERSATLERGAPALAALGVSKRFGVVRALDDVTLVGSAGRDSCAGRRKRRRQIDPYSHIRGRLPARRGRACWPSGVRQTLRSPSDAHALGIRVIHQEPDIVPDLSIAENLFLGDFRRNARSLSRPRRPRAADGSHARRIRARERPAPLDAGGRSRAGPATAHGDHAGASRGLRVLALDEPTSSLTEDEAQRLFRIVRRLRDDGVAIIYISHRMREVRDLADRIAVLRDGRLIDAAADRGVSRGRDRSGDGRATDRRPLRSSARQPWRRRPFGARPDDEARPRCQFRCPLGRGRRPRGADGRRTLGTGGGDFRPRPRARRLRLRRWPAGPAPKPRRRHQRRNGLAPEDRKSQALLLLRSVKDNISLAVPDLISRLASS